MAANPRVSVSDLLKGYRFPTVSVELTRHDVSGYLEAVGDANGVYFERNVAPPLAAAARSLGKLLEVLELPLGSLHTGQEVETLAGVPLDATLLLTGSIAQRSERAGLIVSVIEFELRPEGGEPVLRGRTTIMAPAGGRVGAEA